MTRRQVRKTNTSHKILQEKNLIRNEIENKNDINCLDKHISYGELVELAKHHLNYKGSREELCERLKNIGYKLEMILIF